ncbi:MAG: glycosyltransferase family 9 protein [Saprospiraceae bacterium]|nr:glycosyltransferase family 9 protein [Saprospiraceae bacterium]
MRILVIRLSALGDVSLMVPVLRELIRKNPLHEVFILTHPRFEVLFKNIPNLTILPYNVKEDFKGLSGLLKLFNILKTFSFEKVIDLHQSIRSIILGILFSIIGKKVSTIRKGRIDKKNLMGNISIHTKVLAHTVDRYRDTFIRAGLKLDSVPRNSTESGFIIHSDNIDFVKNKLATYSNKTWIGIAPFSQIKIKEWPFEKMKSLIQNLTQDQNKIIFLFGFGNDELSCLQELSQIKPTQILLSSDHFEFIEELALMSQLNFMLTMDSANMHMAELAGCKKVISIWGPTHQAIGFSPFISGTKNIVEISTTELSCRPCSVFGAKNCHRGDHACMQRISETTVLKSFGR